ncbi:hypothetical protein ACFWHR_06220 [Leucobacter sp. NPDC058333]|uniref:hypothetical protein n=1 Tax=Leucobacter sp. NPDC058333 TaxID=3346450 RepID=UPI00365767CD
MKHKPGRASRESRESSLVSGWTVEGEPEVDLTPGSPQPTGDRVPLPVDGSAEDSASDAVDEAGVVADAQTEVGAGEPRPQISNGGLVVLGVFGGLYLLYTWGWFIVAQAYSAVNAVTAAGSGVIGGVLQQVIFWAAPLAPPLWFFLALAFSRGGRTKRLAILLVIGAVVLVPLPMLIARGA